MSNIEKLYQEVILVHNKSPLFYEKNEGASQIVEAYNAVCGDQFTLYLEKEKGVIQSATFHGYGCAISKASTSILMKNIQGKDIEEVKKIIHLFLSNIKGEELGEELPNPEDFDAFKAANEFPGRKKCATLAWDGLLEYLLQ